MREKLAVQMFTLRDFTATADDLARTLEHCAEIGYPAVQLSAVGAMNGPEPEVNAAQARRLLDDNGLKCIATHRSWDDLVQHTQREIDFHHTLGCNYVAIGALPAEHRDEGADGYRRFVREAPPTVQALRAAGISFGVHNHAHEFEKVAGGQGTFYDILIEAGAPDIMLELDTYWAVHAGVNLRPLIERLHGRVPVVHVKDKEVIAPDGPVMAPVGEGNLDWPETIAAFEAAGTQWYAVEQDVCRRDPFDCLRSSFEFLSTL